MCEIHMIKEPYLDIWEPAEFCSTGNKAGLVKAVVLWSMKSLQRKMKAATKAGLVLRGICVFV